MMKHESKVLRHCEACGIVGYFGKGEWENHLKRAKHIRAVKMKGREPGSRVMACSPDSPRTLR